jgi:IS605 OrfB family transposase
MNKESRWMKDVNHKLSRKIVNYAKTQGVATIKLEHLAGIRQGTTRTSRGAAAQKNNRAITSWTFYQLTQFISYKAAWDCLIWKAMIPKVKAVEGELNRTPALFRRADLRKVTHWHAT